MTSSPFRPGRFECHHKKIPRGVRIEEVRIEEVRYEKETPISCSPTAKDLGNKVVHSLAIHLAQGHKQNAQGYVDRKVQVLLEAAILVFQVFLVAMLETKGLFYMLQIRR